VIEGYHYIPTLNGFDLFLLAVAFGLARMLLNPSHRR